MVIASLREREREGGERKREGEGRGREERGENKRMYSGVMLEAIIFNLRCLYQEIRSYTLKLNV